MSPNKTPFADIVNSHMLAMLEEFVALNNYKPDLNLGEKKLWNLKLLRSIAENREKIMQIIERSLLNQLKILEDTANHLPMAPEKKTPTYIVNSHMLVMLEEFIALNTKPGLNLEENNQRHLELIKLTTDNREKIIRILEASLLNQLKILEDIATSHLQMALSGYFLKKKGDSENLGFIKDVVFTVRSDGIALFKIKLGQNSDKELIISLDHFLSQLELHENP